MPYAEIRGARLCYEERGKGTPLLCIPGALGTGATDFGPQLEEWSDCFRVIAPDPRGYGRSRPPERDFPLDFLGKVETLGLVAAVPACVEGDRAAKLIEQRKPGSRLGVGAAGAGQPASRYQDKGDLARSAPDQAGLRRSALCAWQRSLEAGVRVSPLRLGQGAREPRRLGEGCRRTTEGGAP